MTDHIPPLSPEAEAFKLGIYRHFKGGLYETLCIGRSSEERDQEFVVYRSLEKGYIWIRPLKMFLENVDEPNYNYKGPRFTWIRDRDNI